jgi:hypothetical protein
LNFDGCYNAVTVTTAVHGCVDVLTDGLKHDCFCYCLSYYLDSVLTTFTLVQWRAHILKHLHDAEHMGRAITEATVVIHYVL